jgi:hypothetical protein
MLLHFSSSQIHGYCCNMVFFFVEVVDNFFIVNQSIAKNSSIFN